MVSRRRALPDADGRLRRRPESGGAGGRNAPADLSRPLGRCLRRARAAQRCRGICAVAGIDLLATLPDGKPDRERLAGAAQAAGIRIATTTPGAIFSAGSWSSASRQSRHRPRHYPRRISGRAVGAGTAGAAIRASPSASSFMSAASSSPTALANSTTPPSNAAGSRREMAEKERIYGESLSDRRRFYRRSCADAAGVRHCART